MNARTNNLLLFACLSLFFFGCGPKKHEAGYARPSPSEEILISFSFDSRDGNSGSAASAIVNPWELKEGEMWTCGVETKTDEGYMFLAVVSRTGPASFTFAAGQGTGGKPEAVCNGSLCMNESNSVSATLLFPSTRTLSFEVISAKKADELRKAAKEIGGEFVGCEKEGQVSIQSGQGHR